METLQNTEFTYDDSSPMCAGITPETFQRYLDQLRNGGNDHNELLRSEFSYFKNKIHLKCYQLAKARPDGVEFMQWLKANQWRIVICIYRDLRRSDCTQQWLHDHHIPYDYLFSAQNKIAFCSLWKIKYLIDDDLFNITWGEKYGVNVYYPQMPKHLGIPKNNAKGFNSFTEVRQWIQEEDC